MTNTIYINKENADDIQKAVEKCRCSENPCTIFISKGVYCFDTPLILDSRDSNLTVMGEAGTIFTSARKLDNLKWIPYKNGIWKANVNIKPFGRMFANGAEQILCRYPDFSEGVVPLDSAAKASEIKERSLNYKNPKHGIVRAIHSFGWGGNSYVITEKDKASSCGFSLSWFGDNNRGSEYGDKLVVENVFEELDSPCEWYYDRKEHILYWYPENEINPNEAEITVSCNRELLKIVGESDENPAHNIRIENITFKDTARALFSYDSDNAVYHPLLRGDWCVAREGALYLENTESCEIRNCRIMETGGNGIFFYGYNNGCKITDNEFYNISATAVQIIGNQNSVNQPSYWEHSLYPDLCVHQTDIENPEKSEPKGNQYPRNITIAQNHIYKVGLIEKQSAGINISVATDIKIYNNTIHFSPRSLINVNDGTFGGHDIAYNDLFDSQRETEDHGPFNSWGRDRFWSVPRYNGSGLYGKELRHYKKDGKEFDVTKIDSCGRTRIHHNRFHHCADALHSWGIDLDDGSSNYEIDHNLILGIGIKLREGFDRMVHHNLLVGGQIQIHVPYEEAKDSVCNNLILHRKPFNFVCNKKRFINSDSVIKNNFVYTGRKRKIIHPFLKPQILLQDYTPFAENNYNPAVLIDGWDRLENDNYGKSGCQYECPEYVFSFDNKAQEKKKFIKGALCTAVTEAIRSSTASPDCNGLYVTKVFASTAMKKAGIKPGDILLKINDLSAEKYKSGRIKNIEYRREGKNLKVSL